LKFADIEGQIRTGDYLLVDGAGMVSDLIELVTGGHLSHVGVFFREDGVLKIAEMWQPDGYQDMPAAVRLPQIEGKMYFGGAPDAVRARPEGVLSVINKYRTTPDLRRYGFETLALVAACDDAGAKIAPNSVQAVCSVFAQQTAEACGIEFETLMSPSDFAGWCAEVLPLEL
jgi:hypothetical protein